LPGNVGFSTRHGNRKFPASGHAAVFGAAALLRQAHGPARKAFFVNEDDARLLMLVRAVERADPDAALLTREDRREADAAGRTGLPTDPRRADDAFLAQRARFAAGRLETRQPVVSKVLKAMRWPGWIGLAVPLLALAAGLIANELGNARRLDLLAIPLLGTFAWNVLVYLWIAIDSVRRKNASTGLLGKLARIGMPRIGSATPISRALGAFVADWQCAAAPLNAARASRTLHLGAAAFALGLVGGIYLRALAIEYRAGWESTFLQPAQVRALLATLLGPASALTGIAIPPVEEIAALRWREAGGGDARPWIHLLTVTVAWLVIVPRLLLSGWAAARAAARRKNFPIPGREDFYIRRLLRTATGRAGQVRVTPYAFRPDEALRRRLETVLREAMGESAEIRFDAPVDYGAEDAWAGSASFDPAIDHHLALFSLSSTPEAENHGTFAAALRTKLSATAQGTASAAIVDESAYRARFGGQSGFDERLAGRLRAWEKVLGEAGLAAYPIDLAGTSPEDAQRLEGVLTGGAHLEGGRDGR
jgi:hypothetical protein